MTKHNVPHKSVTIKQRIQVADLLRKHCHLGKDGLAEYDGSTTDKDIAMLADVPDNTVRNMRLELIGKLRHWENPKGTGSAQQLEAHIAKLSERIARLEAYLTSLDPNWIRIGSELESGQ